MLHVFISYLMENENEFPFQLEFQSQGFHRPIFITQINLNEMYIVF
jgi:hypothetical protein